jgi:hypothetical protein
MKRTSTGYTWTRIIVLAMLLLLGSCVTSRPASTTQRALPTHTAAQQVMPTEPLASHIYHVLLRGINRL